ncbi:hypothetical protein GNI_093510 [Gregarina niphandrodes]|uniref:Uncharacterized protein n=1 Tax=Gregarina niphandrodes TaxID=110365 RepID=A0A023B571_GRENI|nr:hypothetical protein GNI_093510 [Gregarina niphandrodes]EZG58898.1 hypothetical protein GNI_093510 [Gregarina niphandrodes]|eukprot:XP_011130929.1 hypothetical protein GNI_093510 [Gregarina niphandrodes]
MKFVKLIKNDLVEIENGGDLENIADRYLHCLRFIKHNTFRAFISRERCVHTLSQNGLKRINCMQGSFRLMFKKKGSDDVVFETNAKYIMLTGVRGQSETNLPQVFLTVDPRVDKGDDESEVWDNLEIELESTDEAESLMNKIKELMNQYKDDLEGGSGDSSSSDREAGTGDEFLNSLMA